VADHGVKVEPLMRADALFRLIMALLFASLPFLLAARRGRRHAKMRAQNAENASPQRPGALPESARPEGIRLDRTRQEIITGASPEFRRVPLSSPRAISTPAPPAVAAEPQAAAASSSGALARVEQLPPLRRAIVYREILGEPRAIDPGSMGGL
jgi:hypothetical protein